MTQILNAMGKQGAVKGVGKGAEHTRPPPALATISRPPRPIAAGRRAAVILSHRGYTGCALPLKATHVLPPGIANVSCGPHYDTYVQNYAFMGIEEEVQKKVNTDDPPGISGCFNTTHMTNQNNTTDAVR